MAFNVRQMPADRAAALIGEDDVAVFSQRLETMAATSQFDLEEPDSTRLTFLFEVGKDDLLREGKWLDGVDYMSDLVFETPRDLAGKIFKRFETFADDDHTPSEALADVRWGFARFGGTCTVLSGLSEKEALDMEKKGDVGANTPNGKAGAEQHPMPSSTCTASSGSSAPRTVSRKPICSAATAAPPTWSTTIPASRQSCPTSPPRRGWSASASTRRTSWRPPSSPSRP